jgi:hypothetical protein
MIRFARVVSGAAAVLMIAGCAAAPSAQDFETTRPTGTPTPTTTTPPPEPGPPATIVIAASQVWVEDADGETIGAVDYAAGGAEVVALMTTALGTPTVVDDDECIDGTIYLWPDYEGFRVAVSSETPAAPYSGVLVSAKVADVGGVAIESEPGFGVGDDITALAASLPPAQNHLDELGALVWETTATVPSGQFGGVIYASDGVVATGLLAPGTIYSGYC